jgi:hypothetical protein
MAPEAPIRQLQVNLLDLDLRDGLMHNAKSGACLVAFSPDHSREEFLLVASFGRSKFRLDTETSGSPLHICLGRIEVDCDV